MKPKIKEVIVVEGKYDKNTLSQVVDATILETKGFGIFKDKEKAALLRKLGEERGLLLFTDSDGAGFVIRNHLRGIVPKEHVKHAYIPDVYGKERRKEKASKEGKLGVEGMTPDILLMALRRGGATFLEETGEESPKTPITKADLMELRLIGSGSKERREALLKKLSLPSHLTPNGLLEVLNLLYTREDLFGQ